MGFLMVSARTGEGLPQLKERLSGKLSCFAGQSAVGKSSLLNALDAHLNLETGGLSRKTERGRHTTRHAELLTVGEGFALDTPGFSLLELDGMEQGEIRLRPLFTFEEEPGQEKAARIKGSLYKKGELLHTGKLRAAGIGGG